MLHPVLRPVSTVSYFMLGAVSAVSHNRRCQNGVYCMLYHKLCLLYPLQKTVLAVSYTRNWEAVSAESCTWCCVLLYHILEAISAVSYTWYYVFNIPYQTLFLLYPTHGAATAAYSTKSCICWIWYLERSLLYLVPDTVSDVSYTWSCVFNILYQKLFTAASSIISCIWWILYLGLSLLYPVPEAVSMYSRTTAATSSVSYTRSSFCWILYLELSLLYTVR